MTADVAARAVGEQSLPALARVCSTSPEEFAEQVWARQAWLSRAGDLPGEVTDVFSAGAVDELLSRRGLRTPFLRLAKDGRIVPPAQYTGSGGAGATVADQVRDDAVLRLFADGTTVVLQGVHRTWEPVRALAADLASELGHSVQVNAYITPPQSQGFAAHYDTHDVFVLQVAGCKRWVVHAPVVDDVLPDEPWEQRRAAVGARAAQAPVLDAVLEPGDCLYLPRGFIHSATALGGTSIHLTFGVHATTQREVARALLDAVAAGAGRASLPVGWSPTSPQGQALLAEVVSRLAEGLTTLDLAAVGAALHDQRAAGQRPEPVSPLAQAAALDELTEHSPVRLRRHLGLRIEPRADGGVDLVLAGRRVPVDADDVPALTAVLDVGSVTPADLPGDGAPALVARLLREGLLVPDDLRP